MDRGDGDERGDSAWARGRQLARVAGFGAFTLAYLPPFVARMRLARLGQSREETRDAWVGRWARALLRLFAFELVVTGERPPPVQLGGRGRVIVANHRSAADIGVMLTVFGGTLLSKDDLADWPILGPAARAADTVFVDRADAASGATALRVVQRRVAEGRTVSLFPEGTTFDGDEVRPFKPGAFVAALGARAEILPVGLAYPRAARATFGQETFMAHMSRLARGPGARVGVAIGEPFVPAKGERAAQVAARAQGAVAELVGRARQLVGE